MEDSAQTWLPKMQKVMLVNTGMQQEHQDGFTLRLIRGTKRLFLLCPACMKFTAVVSAWIRCNVKSCWQGWCWTHLQCGPAIRFMHRTAREVPEGLSGPGDSYKRQGCFPGQRFPCEPLKVWLSPETEQCTPTLQRAAQWHLIFTPQYSNILVLMYFFAEYHNAQWRSCTITCSIGVSGLNDNCQIWCQYYLYLGTHYQPVAVKI